MLNYFNFRDFDDTFFKLNYYFLTSPDKIDGIRGKQALYHNIVVDINSTKTTKINLGALGYHIQKWKHLKRTYLNQEKLEQFREAIKKSGGLSIAFDFNRKDTGNGSCLREIVLTRTKGKDKPFTKATVFWRVTELNRRWAADLIFLARILDSLPLCELEQITFYIPQAYHSSQILPTLYVFGIDHINYAKGDGRFHKMVGNAWEKNFNPKTRNPSKYSYTIRMQEFIDLRLAGKKLPKLTYKQLKLEDD